MHHSVLYKEKHGCNLIVACTDASRNFHGAKRFILKQRRYITILVSLNMHFYIVREFNMYLKF